MASNKLLLNCDLGEGFGHWKMGNDAQIMPFIDQANIACGFHASDPLTMAETVTLAKAHNVAIGAHPGYPDLVGFGRRSMAINGEELAALIQYQVGALQAICRSRGTQVSYVKPHGALYNDMMKSPELFSQICQALAALTQPLPLMVQSTPDNAKYTDIAQQSNITLLFEVFADRNYQDNGLLVPRTQSNAVIEDSEQVRLRIKQLLSSGELLSENGKALALQIDSLCVHGDTLSAVEQVKIIRSLLVNLAN